MIKNKNLITLFALIAVLGSSCGVKAPPIPPMEATAMDSDKDIEKNQTQTNATDLGPTPTPSASPLKSKNKK